MVGQLRHLSLVDHVAHFALAFGLVAMPFAIITGIQSSPGDGIDHPVLINKMLLASAALGLALGVLLARRGKDTTCGSIAPADAGKPSVVSVRSAWC